MFKKFGKLFGIGPESQLKKIWPLVKSIGEHEPQMQALDAAGLKALTEKFRQRLKAGETLDDLLPEAFAAVREVAKRHLKMRHFDVQLVGGIVLHRGKIAEMRTGEGKTLVATLPAYLNALGGLPVHVVTVNNYLARRDASWMGPVYVGLGLTVSCIQSDGTFKLVTATGKADASAKFASVAGLNLEPAKRRDAYACDIVYGTNNEFGFDYLRDNIANDSASLVMTGKPSDFGYALVDEVDNILIDEARTPLVISGPAPDKRTEYREFAKVVDGLRGKEDYEDNQKDRYVNLTEQGISKVERRLKVNNLYAPQNQALAHFLDNALKAKLFFKRDREYIVNADGVVLVDEHTGRLMTGRRLAEGMHQALEAKENVTVQRESMTFATITLQNYFRKYDKLAGMTGTASTESEEFYRIYGLDVVPIPTNRLDRRTDLPDQIFLTEDVKWERIVAKIVELNKDQIPVLVGTTSIEKSDKMAELLRRTKIKFNVLNARQHDKEAETIAQAGSLGAVTVATNVAGRGTDIILGGNPEALQMDIESWRKNHDQVVANGGLFVLGTARHESRRIDNQLRGRSGRQGDPGSTQFFVSMDDELMHRFGGDRMKRTLGALKLGSQEAIESGMLVRAIQGAQQKVEGLNFEFRRNLLEYDDVINVQRDVIYKLRHRIIEGTEARDATLDILEEHLERTVKHFAPPINEESKRQTFRRLLLATLPDERVANNFDELAQTKATKLSELLSEYADELYTKREAQFGKQQMQKMAQVAVLRSIDIAWIQHLTAMANMRQAIGLEAVGQRSPLVQYKRQAYGMFNDLMDEIGANVARLIFNIAPAKTTTSKGVVQPGGADKIGRNSPCHCGSGKKFKKCHGKNA